MKRLLASVIVAAVGSVGLVGCAGGSAGGPGATKDKEHPSSEPGNSFKISVPSSLTSGDIKQGETKAYTFGIDRGKNFDQDVTLKFDGLPKGVTIDPSSPTIKHGDKEISVNFKAADDASVSEHTVTVNGHPAKGPDATNTFKMGVKKK